MSPVEYGREICRLIVGAAYHELRDVGHLVPTEAPAALDAVLDDLASALR